MGNRAIVKQYGTNLGVYLHWNGGRDSVEAFLRYCELRGFRGFDDSYGMARFCQVVGNFFGGGLCLCIEHQVFMNESSSPGDNGIYEVKGWEIVGRYPKKPYEQHEHDMQEMLEYIDSRQPPAERFGKRYLRAKTVPTAQLRIGDSVYLPPEEWEKRRNVPLEIIGFGENGKWVNGHRVDGIPYVNRWPDSGYDPANNPNNYLFDAQYRATLKRRKKTPQS